VARDDVQVVAVCDVRRERRDEAQQRANAMYAQRFNRPGYDGVQAYRDFREVLARPDIDAVLLAVPYHWAAPMSILAMRAGKDVYCEKPVAITVREAGAMQETARRYGRIYQAGTQQRSEYGGKFRIACEWIRNGRIGELREVYAYRQPGAFFPTTAWTSDQAAPVPDGFDWDLWLGPLPWRPYGGEAGHTLSGLFVGDVNWSPHHYDVVQWVVNPDPSASVAIEYDQGRIHYHYPHGVVVHSTEYPGEPVGPEGGACFVGTEGRIAVDRNRIVAYPDHILRQPLRPTDARVEHADSHSGNFLDCIRTRRPPICNPEVAAHTITTILAGGIALALQRNVTWNPATRNFPGDDAANRLLSYSPRPSYSYT
jgi:predicted dehydrogenase